MIGFYFDEHVESAIARELRARAIDVLTAQEDGRLSTDDALLVRRATELGRVFVTRDQGLCRIAAELQRSGECFSGVLYAPAIKAGIGAMVRDLELIAKAGRPQDLANRLVYLPF